MNTNTKSVWTKYRDHAIMEGGESRHWTWKPENTLKRAKFARTGKAGETKPVTHKPEKKRGSTNPFDFTPKRELRAGTDSRSSIIW